LPPALRCASLAASAAFLPASFCARFAASVALFCCAVAAPIARSCSFIAFSTATFCLATISSKLRAMYRMNPATTVRMKVSSTPNLARIVDPRSLVVLNSASRAPKEGATEEEEDGRTNERVESEVTPTDALLPLLPFARRYDSARHATETRARVGRTR